MKKTLAITILTTAFIFSCVFQVRGQDMISPHIDQNGSIFGFDNIFTNPSPLKFSLTKDTIKGEWSIAILTKGGEYRAVNMQEVEQGYCVFNPSSISWRDALRIYDSSLNRNLFEIKIKFTSKEGLEDTKYLKLGLLPSNPEISDITFTYVYNWEKDYIDPNSNFSFVVKLSGATGFTLNETESYLFSPDNIFFFLSEPYEGNEITKIKLDADWGEYLQIEAYNEFGYSLSDTICTTSYITDESVLKRINELKVLADIESSDIDETTPQATWDNSTLSFNKRVKSVFVYNLSGSLIEQGHDLLSLNLAHISRGIYVIVYECDENTENKMNKLKIIKH